MSTKKNIDGEDVLEGYRGNLTKDQQKSLREIYKRLFELYDQNKGRSDELEKLGGPAAASKNKPKKEDSKGKDDAGKDIPKDDKAKEEAKKQEELRDLRDMMDTFGGPYLRRGLWEFVKHDHPDSGILRFLRARKWDLDRALAMLAAALKFRFEMDVEGIIRKGEAGMADEPGFLNQFRRGISYIKGNSDYPGEFPIYFIHVARHFTNAQKHETLQKFVLLAMENARQLTTPPYEKAIVVFDMQGFGLKNMDWQCVLFLVKCLEAYYPESLQRIYVHSAPWIFKGIWQVLQPMLDPVVRDKIKFSSKAADLKDYASTAKLRKGMGGTMDWDWDYIEPDPQENDLQKDTETVKAMQKEYMDLASKFEETTREWIKAGDSDDDAPDLTFRREVIAKQLRLTSLRMNRYCRARNVYQRAGILKDTGRFEWDYPQQGGETIHQTINDRHDIIALRKWLQEHDEDTLDDSVSGRKGYCGVEAEPQNPVEGQPNAGGSSSKSGGGGQESQKPSKPQRNKSERKPVAEGAAAGGAAGGALGAFGALKSKATGKSDENQQSESSQPQSPSQEKPERPPPRQASKNESSQQQQKNGSADNQNGEEQKTYTGAAIGAISGAAAAAGGAAAGAYAYVRGTGENDEQQNGHQQDDSHQEENYDDDEYNDDDDDDGDSNYSDESITPDTKVDLSFISDKPPTAAQVKLSDEECRRDLGTVREAMSLFLNSKMREAEDLCLEGADVRLYKAVGMALINAVKSIMTFEPTDFETAIACCKHAMQLASLLRKKVGTVGKLVGQSREKSFRSMTLVQQHAELVYTESMLLKAVLGIFYAGDSLAFVKHAFSLRNAYFSMRELMKFVEYCDGEAEEAQIHNRQAKVTIDQDFRSGVYFSNGMCSLILSLLPAKALKMMEGLGFTGDRRYSLDLFSRAGGWNKSRPLPSVSADEEGVRRPLCDLGILTYHLVISSYVPVTDVDFEYADKVLSWNLVRFPNGIFFLYMSARLYAAQALPEKAIEYFRNAIESQSVYKQLHHLCFWDLSLTYLATCDFARAYECYDVLSRESNWSKAIYQYAKAIMLYETGMDERAKSATIMRTVPKLTKKIAGRQIPFERFVMLKAKKYIANNNRLPLAALEFSYIWHCLSQTPVFLLVENTLTRIDEFIDELESYHDPKAYGTGENEYWSAYCLAFFLRGVALRFVAYPEPQTLVRLPSDDAIGPIEEITADAKQSFAKVFENGHKLDEVDRYLVYFSHYENGRLLSCMGKDELAKKEFKAVMSGKALEAKGKKGVSGGKASYLLSNMCQVRTHAALETMRITKNRSGSFFSNSSSSFAGGNTLSSLNTSSRTSYASSAQSQGRAGSAATRSTSVSSRASQVNNNNSAKASSRASVITANSQPTSYA